MAKVRSRIWDFWLRADLRSLGAFRIALALVLLWAWWVQWLWLDVFFTDQGVLPCQWLQRAAERMSPFFWSPLVWIDHWPWAVRAFFVFAGLCYLGLLLGWRTRWMSLLSLLCWGATLNRNPYIIIGADRVLAAMLLWGVFLPWGERFSLDALRRALAQGVSPQQDHPWGQPVVLAPRLSSRHLAILGVVLQIGLIYLMTALWKSGWTWRQGVATYLVLHIDQFIYAPALWIREIPLQWHKAFTWGTLAVEYAALPCLLLPWFQPWLRRAVILGLVTLHLGIMLTLDEGLFSQVMMSTYLVLLTPRDWEALERLLRHFSRPVTAYYDDTCGICQRTAQVICLLDRFGMIRWVGTSDPGRFQHALSQELVQRTVVVVDEQGRQWTRTGAFVRLARSLPLPWHAAVVLLLPGVRHLSDRLYDLVARNRHRISAWLGWGSCGLPQPQSSKVSSSPTSRHWRRWVQELGAAVVLGSVLISCYEENLVPALAHPSRQVHLPHWGRSLPNPILHLFQAQQIWYMFAPEVPLCDMWWVAPAQIKGLPEPVDLLTGKPVRWEQPPWQEHRYERIWGTFLFFGGGHQPTPSEHPDSIVRESFCRYLVRRYERSHPGQKVEKLELFVVMKSVADQFLGRPVREGRLLLATWEPIKGHFALGPPHGWIRMFDPQGKLLAEGAAVMTNYLTDGYWTIRLPDGSVEEGQYQNGHRHGLWRKRFPDGSWFEGHFRHGLRQGTWRLFYPHGTLKAQGQFVNDAMQGVWTTWYPNGKRKQQLTYHQGQLHGPYMLWHSNGWPKQRGYYQHGQLHGPWQSWYANGRLEAQGEYVQGKRHGRWEFWDSEGLLGVEVHYEHGREIRRQLISPQKKPHPGPNKTGKNQKVPKAGSRVAPVG